ncbi:MAG: hypothetical protein ABT00_00220 [Bordetella sp. SCN 68-11]|nr:MAG: hypothetical protein ABT00_00220 [Bordetella sp. SCN 68-11]
MNLRIRLAVLAGIFSMTAAAANAQSFPTKPVRILTPSSVGSGPDVALRAIAEQLGKKWGQPVIVDNRPGGNGFVATGLFKQAKPDGYELIAPDSSHIATHPHTFRKLPYDPQKDFEPIRPILNTAFFVVVGANSPYKTLADIVQAAREQPGRVTYGSWFVGSPGHPGEVGWTLGSDASAGPLEKAGKLRYLAIAAPARSPIHPQVPSVDESPDTKGYDVQAWVGLFAPPGTPEAIKQRISDDVAAVLKSPQIVERYRLLGYENPDLDPGQFAARIQRDTDAWGAVIKQAGLRLDD